MYDTPEQREFNQAIIKEFGMMRTNKESFDMANKTRDLVLQAKLREDFLRWCKENGRTPLNPESIKDWWKEVER